MALHAACAWRTIQTVILATHSRAPIDVWKRERIWYRGDESGKATRTPSLASKSTTRGGLTSGGPRGPSVVVTAGGAAALLRERVLLGWCAQAEDSSGISCVV